MVTRIKNAIKKVRIRTELINTNPNKKVHFYGFSYKHGVSDSYETDTTVREALILLENYQEVKIEF